MDKKVTIHGFNKLENRSNISTKYEKLIDTGFCYIDYIEGITYISSGVFKLLNIDEETVHLTLRQILNFIVKKERKHFVKHFFSRMALDAELNGQYSIFGKNGNSLTVNIKANTCFDKEHNPTYTVATIKDITLEAQEVRKLKVLDQQLRAIFEESNIGIIIASAKSGKFISANPAICEMLGYEYEELLKLTPLDIHPKYSLEDIMAIFKDMGMGITKVADNKPMLRKDGSVFHVDIVGKHIEVDGEKMTVGYFTDISK